jgi:hypothetical protein
VLFAVDLSGGHEPFQTNIFLQEQVGAKPIGERFPVVWMAGAPTQTGLFCADKPESQHVLDVKL